jgi:hypothetical protein
VSDYETAVDTYDRESARRSPRDAAIAVFIMRADLDTLTLTREYDRLTSSGAFSPRDAFLSIMADHCDTDSLIDDSEPAPRYWVLQVNGYSDTRRDYARASNRDAVALELVDLGYLENPAVTVYAGDRTPWAEEDPYPDWVVSRGPRGGVRWERA